MPGTQGWSRWRFVIAPRWVAWHLFIVVSVLGMLVLGDWQLHRAEAGNGLSWAYTFEWPLFAIMAVVFWVKTLRDEARPPARPQTAGQSVQLPGGARPAGTDEPASPGEDSGSPEEEAELAAYNAYLARLQREVKGHGRWHGFR